MKKSAVRLLAAFTLFVLALPLRAQTTGSIRGVVETGQTALPGVTVEARSPNLQGSRTSVTDAEGRFNAPSLPPGIYTVVVKLDGFGPKSRRSTLGSTRPPRSGSSCCRFRRRRSVVRPRRPKSRRTRRRSAATSTQGLPVASDGPELLLGRPARQRSQHGRLGPDRHTAITVYGSTGLENSYLVDGANTTGVEIGNQGKVLNFEFIQEVEIKAGGYEAEYGGAQGGILNVVTKSGGNEFHGDVFGYLDDDDLQAESKHLDEMTSEGIPVGYAKSDFGSRPRRVHPEGPVLVLRGLRPRQQHSPAPGDDRALHRDATT